MKICIIGGSGVIGSKMAHFFKKEGYEVIVTYKTNKEVNFEKSYSLDITNTNATLNFLETHNPEIVIHAAGITNVDLCETNKELADAVNIKGTKNIVNGCKQIKKKIIYLSTGYVFDGKKKEYFEDDETNAHTYYGFTKMKGEEIVIKSGLPYLILRTDQPYCWTEKYQHTNSVLRVIETLKTGKIMNEIEDWYNNPTYVPDLVLATSELIKKKSKGIFHLVGPDFINRYEWSVIVAKICNLDKTKIKPINSKKLNLEVKRTNINLKNLKITQETGLTMKGVNEGIISMLNEIKK